MRSFCRPTASCRHWTNHITACRLNKKQEKKGLLLCRPRRWRSSSSRWSSSWARRSPWRTAAGGRSPPGRRGATGRARGGHCGGWGAARGKRLPITVQMAAWSTMGDISITWLCILMVYIMQRPLFLLQSHGSYRLHFLYNIIYGGEFWLVTWLYIWMVYLILSIISVL